MDPAHINIPMIIGILAAAGIPKETIIQLTHLLTKKTSVIVYDKTVSHEQVEAALNVALHFNHKVYIEKQTGTRLPEIVQSFAENGMSMIVAEQSSLYSDDNGLRFDAENFSAKSGESLDEVAFIHSRSIKIDSGNHQLLEILFESLVIVSKVLNAEQLPAIQQAIRSAA